MVMFHSYVSLSEGIYIYNQLAIACSMEITMRNIHNPNRPKAMAICRNLLQEFLKWIFAENKDISKGLQGKYMLSVSGRA